MVVVGLRKQSVANLNLYNPRMGTVGVASAIDYLQRWSQLTVRQKDNLDVALKVISIFPSFLRYKALS